MWKWLKWTLIALAGLGLAAGLTVFFGGRWAIEHYLGRDLKVGEGRLRLKDPEFRWSLSLDADSLIYDAPALRADAGRVSVSADLFRSLLRFSPSVKLDVDTLRLSLRPVPDSARKPKAKKENGSLAFPDFKIPVSTHVRAKCLALSDTGGERLRLTDVTLDNRGKREVHLAIRDAAAPQLRRRALSLDLSLDWSAAGRVAARLEALSRGDSVDVSAHLDKKDMSLGDADVRILLASTQPYTAFMKGKPPSAAGLDLRARAARDARGLAFNASLQAALEGLPDSLPLRPGVQRIKTRVDFSGDSGSWSLHSAGSQGGEIDLGGSLEVTGRDSLANPAWLFRHLAATARGSLKEIPVRVGGRNLEATLAVERARWSQGALAVRASTGDTSVLEADVRQGRKGWNGKFSLDLAKGEKWVAAFADTNVVYARMAARGEITEGRVRAAADVYGMRAYGLLADSLHANLAYGPEGATLGPCKLAWRDATWDLAVRLRSDRPGKPVTARLSNPKFGSAEFSMPKKTVMEASVRDLFVEKLPYRGLDTLGKNQPRVSADFHWDKAARSGSASVSASGVFKNEALRGRAEAAWDRERLELRRADVDFSAGWLRATGAVKLRGRQFYELKGMGWHDVDLVTLEAGKFDLAKAMRVFNPNPPLSSGTLEGKFSFGDSLGFRGEYRVRDLQPRQPGLILVKDVRLAGDGDTLRIRGVTVSKQEPLLNDSLSVALTGVLGDVQSLSVDVGANKSLFLGLRGRMHSFKDLEADFALSGGAALPGRSGDIHDLEVKATASLDFKDPLGSLRLQADTLKGRYVVAGVDSQAFSAPLRIADGRLAISRLEFRGSDSSRIQGKVEYGLKGARVMKARLAGGNLVLQLGKDDRVQLRDFEVDVHADSTKLQAQASIGSASAEHVKSPLRAAGDLSSVEVLYRAPLGKPRLDAAGTGSMAYLQVGAVLDSSELRYRVRSFQILQDLFKRKPAQRRQAKPVRPMQVRIDLETAGTGNMIETDILRVNYVGNFSMHGVYPYALVQGRINSSQGELGTKSQAYKINRFEVKWLNSTLEEGEVDLEAQKNLAVNCEAGTTDSCKVYNRLTGPLSDMRFSYESDCGGAFGAGADVAALIYSVRRGCYSSAFSAGGSGLSYQEQALALLEPLASEKLSEVAGYLSGHWIAETRITGLGTLASKNKARPDTGSAAGQAIALEVISKEFWRTRLSMRSYYRPQETETANPWAYRLAVEWRPPLFRIVKDPDWKRRIKNNVSLEASIYSDTTGAEEQRKQEGARRRLGLNYAYNFWGGWWAKPDTAKGASGASIRRRTAGSPRRRLPLPDSAQ